MSSEDASSQVRLEGNVSAEKVEETQDQNEGSGMPSPQEEEAAVKKKYGGRMPKKSPLISKVNGIVLLCLHFPFQIKVLIRNELSLTADWALGKQGGGASKPKGPLEALRPKLQPTQQNARARRSSYASADNDESLSLPADELIRKDVPAEDKNQQ
ncbi:hypothetical protein ACQ4PT_038887 [Festuca glaucescens]